MTLSKLNTLQSKVVDLYFGSYNNETNRYTMDPYDAVEAVAKDQPNAIKSLLLYGIWSGEFAEILAEAAKV